MRIAGWPCGTAARWMEMWARASVLFLSLHFSAYTVTPCLPRRVSLNGQKERIGMIQTQPDTETQDVVFAAADQWLRTNEGERVK